MNRFASSAIACVTHAAAAVDGTRKIRSLSLRVRCDHPKGMRSFSSGLRGTSYPGYAISWGSNPERVASPLLRLSQLSQTGTKATCTNLKMNTPIVSFNSRPWHTHVVSLLLVALLFCSGLIAGQAASSTAELKNLSVNGGVEDGKARLVIEALLNRLPGDQDKAIFATALEHSIKITPEKLTDSIFATLDILEGEPKELPFTITGEGEIRQVTGEALLDWSVRQETNGLRILVLRPRKTDKPFTRLTFKIVAERELKSWPNPLTPLTLIPAQPALLSGYLKVESAPELQVQPDQISGLIPIELKFLPESQIGR